MDPGLRNQFLKSSRTSDANIRVRDSSSPASLKGLLRRMYYAMALRKIFVAIGSASLLFLNSHSGTCDVPCGEEQ